MASFHEVDALLSLDILGWKFGIFLFEVDYLAIGEVNVTDFRWLDLGRAEVTYFVTWLAYCDEWGVGGLLCPHPDISATTNSIFFCVGMAMQLGMSCLVMWKFLWVAEMGKKL
jgi:hypothetical protein